MLDRQILIVGKVHLYFEQVGVRLVALLLVIAVPADEAGVAINVRPAAHLRDDVIDLRGIQAAGLVQLRELVPRPVVPVGVDLLGGVGDEPTVVLPGVVELDQDALPVVE